MSVVRDWGWAPEYVEAMWLMMQQTQAEDYVIATGSQATLEDFATTVFERLGLNWRDHVDHDPSLLRPFDVDFTIGNASKAKRDLDWKAQTYMVEVATRLVDG